MASIRLGLIGLGEWARRAYVPILRELGEVEVVAVSACSETTHAVSYTHLRAHET